MKLNNYFLKFVALAIFFYITTWVFNHFSPWVSILMIIVAIGYFLGHIDKNINNQNK
jgi:hypothetical protein